MPGNINVNRIRVGKASSSFSPRVGSRSKCDLLNLGWGANAFSSILFKPIVTKSVDNLDYSQVKLVIDVVLPRVLWGGGGYVARDTQFSETSDLAMVVNVVCGMLLFLVYFLSCPSISPFVTFRAGDLDDNQLIAHCDLVIT